MKYMGSKSRIAAEILPIILKDRTPEQYYVEPMVGGANVIDKVTGNRLAADKSKYLIAMWKGLQEDKERPRLIPKDLYDRARTEFNNQSNHEFDDFSIGWIGFMASFNGRFFDGGYNGNYLKRDYTKESISNVEKQVEAIRGIDFRHATYDALEIPDRSIIYCDIPYKNTKQYATSANFNHPVFWDWCRTAAAKGHSVFVSEYAAPDDFECVWSKEVTNSMNTTKTTNPIEKLFRPSTHNNTHRRGAR